MAVEQNVGEDPDPTEFLFITMEMRLKDRARPYDVKTACWVPDDAEGYTLGEIKGTDGDQVQVWTGGEEKCFNKEQVDQVNSPKYEKCEDMSNLSFLNDASVLHNLRERYLAKLIYTYSGLFCIAINPYTRYPIYTLRAMKIYAGKRRNEVPPHIFAVAEGAYQHIGSDRENQSILITGESGAGKTENTKKIIAYFANVSGGSKKKKAEAAKRGSVAGSKRGSVVAAGGMEVKEGQPEIAIEEEEEPEFVAKIPLEDQIVQTNPVLESFGNAKTTRNDNSSRFGKFIRIWFGPTGKLAGADIESYLLEKARVISQMPAERCFHIFYQLMSAKSKELGIKDMCLLGDDIYYYHFVSQGKITVPSIDDGDEMEATHGAFEILNFSPTERENIYKITAAVMHMGEMKFKQKGREEQAEPDGLDDGNRVAELLGVNGEEMYRCICKPKIKVGSELVIKGQNVPQCCNQLGAMAKSVYDRMFKFLVKKCNETLDTKQRREHFGGVLDIAGFEIFEENGFDQLCINFTNEKLQQFFNHHMFVLEQEEYKKEGLDWIFQDFGMDLQACIECFEKKLGIFSILEEQSTFPKATDKSFEDMLKTNLLGKNPCFLKPKLVQKGQKESHFAMAHYAGTVSYNICGWLDKNKDPLNDTVVDIWKKGTNALVVTIYADHPGQSGDAPAPAGGGKGGDGKKAGGFKTVSAAYRDQLSNLMTTLRATHPHFIRCIVPNEVKTPGLIDAHLVMHQLTCNGVLEGIRICRRGFPNRINYPDFKRRYLILAPELIKANEGDDKKMAIACFDHVGMEAERYRVGHTKVFFRAGTLGDLEEIRDDKMADTVTRMQSTIRTYLVRKKFRKDQNQRVALFVVQTNLRAYVRMKTWRWANLMAKIKPMVAAAKVMEEMRRLEDRANYLDESVDNERKLIKEFEEQTMVAETERLELEKLLMEERSKVGEYGLQLPQLTACRDDLESQLRDTQERLVKEEQALAHAYVEKKQMEQELLGLRKEAEDAGLSLCKLQQDTKSKDYQIRTLNDEISRQDELINRLTKEKKQVQELSSKIGEELQGTEDKVSHLNKVKRKLEQTLAKLGDALEQEKSLRADLEKGKRKTEVDLKLTNEAASDLERNKRELEHAIQRKDKGIQSLIVKLENEESTVSKLHKQIKELQARIEELEEELKIERQASSKAENQRSDLARDIAELRGSLDEAGGVTSAQIELNRKREAELAKLRRDVEEAHIQHESATAGLQKKHNDAVAEMAEQMDTLNKLKSRAEKERAQMANELNENRTVMDQLSNEKSSQEKLNKQWQNMLCELQSKFDYTSSALQDVEAGKKRLDIENSELMRTLEDADTQVSQLNMLTVSLASQLEDVKRSSADESRERGLLLGRFRAIEYDQEGLRKQLDEESEGKADVLRQLSKATAEAQLWRAKYESEGIARSEELEEAKRKLQTRLGEAEQTVESLNQKVAALDKDKQRLSTILEDMELEVERAKSMASSMEKKQQHFDKIIDEWTTKVNELSSELDNSQRECRNYSTELFRLKAVYDESQTHLETVRGENKNFIEEIRELMDQIGEGGRAIHEIDKARRRLEVEKEELQAACEEAESALEQEESKLLRASLELSQVRQEIERRIHEKEVEFENSRKNHQRALDSMQASLEAESKAKAEALRMKKKLESDIGELELALDHSNKANIETQKGIKRYQQQLRETQQSLEEEHGSRDAAREAFSAAERRVNALANELEESRTLLEQANSARRNAEQELTDAHDQLNEMGAQAAFHSTGRRKVESEIQRVTADLEEILNEAKLSDYKAKMAMVDAARLADELRADQEHAQVQDKMRKQMELHMKELQSRLSEAENKAMRGEKKSMAKLEERVRAMEQELDGEQRRHADCQKNLRRNDRRLKELTFQADEDRKNHERMQELVDTLQQKIKTYKRQIEEAEEITAQNLAKFRKAQQDLEEAEVRSAVAVDKVRSAGRTGSVSRAAAE